MRSNQRNIVMEEEINTRVGLIYYLYHCWEKETSCNLRPDMIWHTIIGETTQEIFKNIEKYTHLLSKPTGQNREDLFDKTIVDPKFKKLILNGYYKRCILTLNDLCYFTFNHEKLSPLLNKLKLISNSRVYNAKELNEKYLHIPKFWLFQ